MSDRVLLDMDGNPEGSGQEGEDLRRSSRPNLGIPPERLGAVPFPSNLLTSTHVTASGIRMTRTTIVAPPDLVVKRRVEDDAGSTSSTASHAVSMFDEQIEKTRKKLTLLQEMRDEAARDEGNESQQLSGEEDGDGEPDDTVNPDYVYQDPSTIQGGSRDRHVIPTPNQPQHVPLWRSKIQKPDVPSPPPPSPPKKAVWRPPTAMSTPIGVGRQPQRNPAPKAELNSVPTKMGARFTNVPPPPPRNVYRVGNVVGQPPPHNYQSRRDAVGQPPLQQPLGRKSVVEQPSPQQSQDDGMGALANAIVKALQSQNKQTEKFVARQSKASELPMFTGNPLDWPLFAHHYEQSTRDCGFTAAQNMGRLEKALKGEARRHVRALMIVPENADNVMTRLEQRYGRPEFVVQALVDIARKTPTPKEGRLSTIVDFAGAVVNLVTTISTLKMPEYLHNPQLLQELVEKLPDNLKLQWGMTSVMRRCTLTDFAEWVDLVAGAASMVSTPKLNFRERKEDGFNAAVEETTTSSSSSSPKSCPVCSKDGHPAASCERFRKMTVDGRWKLVKEKSLCFRCLGKNHSIRECRSKWSCKAEGCTKRHHTLLHGQVPASKEKKGAVEINATVNQAAGDGAILRIAAVTLHGPKGRLVVNALLDEGSTVTLLSDKVAESLGLKGPQDPLRLRWTDGALQTENGSRKVSCLISPFDADAVKFSLKNVRTVKSLKLPAQRKDLDEIAKKWSHLQEIKFKYLPGMQPLILIGQPHSSLTIARDVREAGMDVPMMTQTRLGWVLHGPLPGDQKEDYAFSCIHESDEDILHKLVKESFSLDSIGIMPVVNTRSRDDEEAEKRMELVSRRIRDRWETGLLWRKEPVKLPPSHDVAFRRYLGIERKLKRHPDLKRQYDEKLNHYLTRGYARKLSKEELAVSSDVQWFLPIFDTTHPNKPGKIRIVFDAASRSHGVSLNDFLLTGPDLLVSLPGILVKFRQRKYAFSGDIAEMFHQVRIRAEDCPAQRFLYKEKDDDDQPSVYQLEVMMFGAACSPYCAQYIKNQNAMEFSEEFPAASNAIIHKHYMDDYLDSVDTEGEALKLALEVKEVHRRGGFDIAKWMSNSPELMKTMGAVVERTKDMAEWSEVPTERALGLHWIPGEDSFTFRVNLVRAGEGISTGKECPTKRGVLRLVMLVWDPLGFLAHFIIKARILLQDIWRCKIGWDDEIPSVMFSKWKPWVLELPQLSKVRIRRCYSEQASRGMNNQIHIFADSSEKAGCCVAYLRVEVEDDVEVTFVMAKSRVAPVKPVSVPRLELNAALMASRLGKFVESTLDIEIHDVVYWTDSMTVLRWIRSEARRFQTFVANRVGEIQESTGVQQWRWVPTKDNPADDGTRDGKADLSPECRWWNGPDFLKLHPEAWPKIVNGQVEETEELELKKECVAVLLEVPSFPLPNVTRFSNYMRLVRSTAYVMKFVEWIKSRQKLILDVLPLKMAEMKLIRRSQWESYGKEMQTLTDGGEISRSSSLFQLNPVLDPFGVMRMKSRLISAESVGLQMPIILHPKEQLTVLLIKHYHKTCLHQGEDYVRNEIRQRYWIPHLRNAVRKVIRDCCWCKVKRVKAQPPLMGNLPSFRIQPQPRAFTIVGMDYFGPMDVTIGRRHEKRYGVLFTCLNTRAVHLELAHSLNTDSCIMAIRRMISRRGQPTQIHSDNGSNLKSANKELREALLDCDRGKMSDEITAKGIEWNFIPPSSPHMGGTWERLVRSVKTALAVILKSRSPREEVLKTVLAEAESTVNSRPLTEVPVDPESPEALTPFHFLIGTSSIAQPPGIFDSSDLNLRKQWRQVQALADMFWKRWLREYIPTLQRRQKWHGKTPAVEVGDMVILFDDSLKRNHYPLGLVTQVYPGKDGIVRVADVKTSTGMYRRPVVKMGKLDIKAEGDQD